MPKNTDRCDPLLLKNQLCFPLYACSKEVIRRYRPLLDALDLTYTQYLVMMLLWEQGESSMKELGERLFLDSGTLTPVIKALENKGFLKRRRSVRDERVLMVQITPEGVSLREKAQSIPEKMSGCVCLPPERAELLYELLYEILGNLNKGE